MKTFLHLHCFQAIIYAIQKLRKVSYAKAEEMFLQGPQRFKAEKEQLQQEMDGKTLSKEEKKRYRQRHLELPYSSEDDDEDDDEDNEG